MISVMYAKRLEDGRVMTSYCSEFINGYEIYKSMLQFSIWLEWQENVRVEWK